MSTLSNDVANTTLLMDVMHFSALAHENQRRKNSNKSPYINHPIHVANLLTSAGVTDIDTLCGALLHDTVEDTGTTYETLVERFGKKIADIVKECTDDKSLDKVERKKLQIEHVKSSHMSSEAKYVKLGDKLSNLSNLAYDPPANWSKEEIKGYGVWCYCVCREIFGLNEKLDLQLKRVFHDLGIDELMNDEKQLMQELESYYTYLSKPYANSE